MNQILTLLQSPAPNLTVISVKADFDFWSKNGRDRLKNHSAISKLFRSHNPTQISGQKQTLISGLKMVGLKNQADSNTIS